MIIFINLIITILIFYILIRLNNKFFAINKKIYFFLIIYHFLITFIIYNFFIDEPADFRKFLDYETFLKIEKINFTGKNFIYILVHVLRFFQFSNFNLLIFFSSLSLIGIIFIYLNLKLIGLKTKISYLILFIPGIHIWTCLPGKDSLMLFCISLFFYFFLLEKKKIYLIFIILIYLIRPHIGLLFVSSLIIYFLFTYNNKLKLTIFLIFLSLTILNIFMMINENFIFSFFYEKIELANIYVYKYDHTNLYYEPKNNFFNILNYLIFPIEFFLSFNNIYLNFIISSEIFNLFLIIVCLSNSNKKIILDNKKFLFMIFLIALYLIIFPNVFFNAGISLRQKWQIYPFLIYFLFFFRSKILNKINP